MATDVPPTRCVSLPSVLEPFAFLLCALLNLSQQNQILFIALVGTLAVLLATCYTTSPHRKLPPGPRGLPLLGNALDLRKRQWLVFTEWKKTHGTRCYLFDRTWTTHRGPRIAEGCCRPTRSSRDRPPNIVAARILTGGLSIVFQNHGPLLRRMRKAANDGLRAANKFHDTQLYEAILLTLGMLAQPAAWEKHIRCAAASMVLSITYDRPTVESEDDQAVKDVNDFVARLTRAALPGAHFVEFLPWMMYMPSRFAKWKREAEEWFATDSVMFENLYNSVGTSIANGVDRPSLSAFLIKGAERNQLSVRENSWLAATMYAAGADTTSAVMAWWQLAMVACPETQKRAQAEVDAVVGRERIPTFADYSRLPYVRAMVKEALRWRPVDPLGMPHRSTDDDWYEGMFIPAGTICIANVWALNRDPELYGADAHHFNPARFLDDKGNLIAGPPDTKEEGHVTYGFGRRVCLGKYVANNSLFIDIVVMLWGMNIGHAKDSKGNDIPIDVDGWVEDGLVVRPVPFQCHITPRFQDAPLLLAHEKELLPH